MAKLTRNRIVILVIGVLIIIASVPIGLNIEQTANGGGSIPDTGITGIGYILMGMIAVVGLLMVYVALRKKSIFK